MAVTDQVPGSFSVAIDGVAYAVDVARLQFGTMELIRQQADTSDRTGEHTVNPADLWRRSQDDWSLGAGQEWLDKPGESSPLRFWTSSGVDPWERGRLRLLPATVPVSGLDQLTTTLKVVVAGGRVYVARAVTLAYSTNLTIWTATTSVPDAGTIADIATDGYSIYVTVKGTTTAANQGLYRYTLDSDTAVAVVTAATLTDARVGFAKGRLLLAQGPDVHNITDLASGVLPASLTDSVNPQLRFDTFGEGNAGIYAAAFSRDTATADVRADIFRLGVREDGTALRSAVPVGAGIPSGERVRAILGYLGVVLLGTSQGVRVALESGGGLAIGPVIEIGDVRGLHPHGRFVWAAVKGDDHTGLVRFDLSRFLPGQDLVPAHANDLEAGTGQPLSVVRLGGRMVFNVEGENVYAGHATNLVASATVDFGRVGHGLADKKIFHALEWRTEALPAGASIQGQLFIDGAATAAIDQTQASGTDSGPHVAADGKGEYANVKLTVTGATDATKQVEVTRWLLRSTPVPRRSDAFPIPLDLRKTVDTLRGEAKRRSPEDEYAALQVLVSDGRPVQLQVLARTLTAFVDRVVRGEGLRLSEDGRAFEGPCTVMMRVFDV